MKHVEGSESLLNPHWSLCGDFRSLLQTLGLFHCINTKGRVYTDMFQSPSVKPDNKEIVSDSGIWNKTFARGQVCALQHLVLEVMNSKVCRSLSCEVTFEGPGVKNESGKCCPVGWEGELIINTQDQSRSPVLVFIEGTNSLDKSVNFNLPHVSQIDVDVKI